MTSISTAHSEDTYTTAAQSGTAKKCTGVGYWAIQVKGEDVNNASVAATAWSVVLEVSLDGGATFSTVQTHANTDGDKIILWSTIKIGAMFRTRLVSVTLGSAHHLRVIVLGAGVN